MTGARTAPCVDPDRHHSVLVHSLSDEAAVVWRMLELPAKSREVGRNLWPSLTEFNRYWREYRAFIAQARAYDDAAQRVRGASAALLLYYVALNLAKAELLRTQPTKIYQQRLGHGLSYNPSRAKTFRGEIVRTNPGVFSMLYEERTGVQLAGDDELRIVGLLAQTSDVGFELGRSIGEESRCFPVEFGVCWNQDELWYVVSGPSPKQSALGCAATRKFLARYFEDVRDHAVSRNHLAWKYQPAWMLQSRAVFPRSAPGADAPDAVEVANVQRSGLDLIRQLQGVSVHGYDEWAGSLLRSRWLPMPPDLARYAAMFYCSSVARYRPSMLLEEDSGASWVLDAFVAEARIHVLRAALPGVTGDTLALIAN